MIRTILGAALVAGALWGSATASGAHQESQPPPAAIAPDGSISVADQNAIVRQYCVVCHDDARNTGGLSLERFDAGAADPAVAASMIDMLNAGSMPPRGQPRPDAGTLHALAAALAARAIRQPAALNAASAVVTVTAPVVAKPSIVEFTHDGDRMTSDVQTAVLQTVCVQCHTDRRKPGGVSFEHLTIDDVVQRADLAERMIAKLRAGMMPPMEAPKRPDDRALDAFASSLEQRIDDLAAAHPEPGARPSARLNRVEYARAVKRLLGLDVDVSRWLPPDTMSHNFDNIAAVQEFSPTLLQSYLDAAGEISRLAVGDAGATPTSVTYDIPQRTSQVERAAGAPLGTRGGVAEVHVFPADGEYRFKLTFFGTLGGRLFGLTTMGEQIQIAIDDRQVALLDVDPRMNEAAPPGLTIQTGPIAIAAGPHRVAAAFVERAEGPIDDLIAPQTQTLADLDIGDAKGLTLLPHLRSLTINGPFNVTGVSDNETRRRIVVCTPSGAADEARCARTIVERLARLAYRGDTAPGALADLMRFYERGRARGSFDAGITMALQAILVSPQFLFRIEPQPPAVRPGQDYRIADRALASRLSYFLWAEPPDETLLTLAAQGRLHNLTVLDAQAKRMLKDPRSIALASRFAAQWLRLQDVAKVRPDAVTYPMYDGRIARAMVTETERFFDSIVRDDRDVLDLLTADYTYVNEALASFYGIPHVAGPDFRKVPLAGTHRRGLLGQGSILVETSVATRSDPVLRGKWVLEVLLGQPPPPPPPNVPPLDSTAGVSADGHPLSVRQRMEEHRKNPFCASCHRVIDPIGLALEHFEPTGQWRITDNDVPVDASGTLYDGTPMNGLDGLIDALMKRRETFLRVFTENLMAYAIGRDVQYFDRPAIRAIVRSAAPGNRFSSFVIGIVNSSAFRMSRASDASVRETAGGAAGKRF